MKIETDNQEDLLLITLKGERLDVKEAPKFRKAVEEIVAPLPLKKVALDLKEIHLMDSSGFGSLISINKLVKAKGSSLYLLGLSEHISSMFQMLNLDKYFHIYPNREALGQSDQEETSS